MKRYIGKYVVINMHTHMSIAMVRVRTVGGDGHLKTISKCIIVYPLEPSIDLKRKIQRRIKGTYYKKESFLDDRKAIQALFEKDWS